MRSRTEAVLTRPLEAGMDALIGRTGVRWWMGLREKTCQPGPNRCVGEDREMTAPRRVQVSWLGRPAAARG
jgi:hypothetical protein